MSKTKLHSMAWLICALVLVLAAPASAYRMIVETSYSLAYPDDYFGPGDWIIYDIYLDTEGESGITLLSFGLMFDPTVLMYRPDLSEANDYYPLYAPAPSVGKGARATWLEPFFNPPALWGGAPPPAGAQVNVDFQETGLGETVATATRLYLATLSFSVISPGYPFSGGFTFNDNGNIFLAYGVDVKDSVEWVFVPEPTTALLIGLGLAGLGWTTRHRR